MSAKDVFHEVVKRALEKEGWRITHDPLQVKFEIKVVIDLGAEELIGAERKDARLRSKSRVSWGLLRFRNFILRWVNL